MLRKGEDIATPHETPSGGTVFCPPLDISADARAASCWRCSPFVQATFVFALAFLLRIQFLSEIAPHPLLDINLVPGTDMEVYIQWARRIAAGNWLGRGDGPFWQGPAYPYFLGSVFALFGPDLFVPQIIQAVLGGLTAVAVYATGLLLFSPAVGLLAGFLTAAYGMLVFFGVILHSTTLEVFLAAVALLFLALASRRGGSWWLWAGVAIGLAALARPNFLIVSPCIAVGLWIRDWRGDRRVLWRTTALFLTGVVLVVLPVTIRNVAIGKQFVVSVELDPPRGADPGPTLERASMCKEHEVDAINVADGPRASARMSAQALCVLMQTTVGVDTILHYTCRDRNLLGIQSDLLGAYALGLRNILAITGDPPKLGNYPDATAVYDVDSIGLIRIMDHLNHGCDLAGNLIGPALGLHIGCGADPSKPDKEKEVRRLEQKVAAGAEYVMTQPVYDPKTLEQFFAMIKHIQVPVLVGILPLYSHRNAEFLHNEVPGMIIPEDIRERMQRAGSGEKAQAEGVAIAQEATLAARELGQGIYIMPPFNKVDLALRVIEVLE